MRPFCFGRPRGIRKVAAKKKDPLFDSFFDRVSFLNEKIVNCLPHSPK